MKLVKSLYKIKKQQNRCPDCGKPVNLIKMHYSCTTCGCSGYLLIDVERWSCSV